MLGPISSQSLPAPRNRAGHTHSQTTTHALTDSWALVQIFSRSSDSFEDAVGYYQQSDSAPDITTVYESLLKADPNIKQCLDQKNIPANISPAQMRIYNHLKYLAAIVLKAHEIGFDIYDGTQLEKFNEDFNYFQDICRNLNSQELVSKRFIAYGLASSNDNYPRVGQASLIDWYHDDRDSALQPPNPTLSTELQKLKSENLQLLTQLAGAKKVHDQRWEQYVQALTAKSQEHVTQIANLIAHTQALADENSQLLRTNAQERTKSNRQHAAWLAELQKQSAVNQEHLTACTQAMADQSASHQKQIQEYAELVHSLKTQTTQLTEKNQAHLCQISAKHQQNLEALRTQHRASISEIKLQLEQQQHANATQFEARKSELEALTAKHSAELSQLQTKQAAQLELLEQNHTQLQRTITEALSELQKQHTASPPQATAEFKALMQSNLEQKSKLTLVLTQLAALSEQLKTKSPSSNQNYSELLAAFEHLKQQLASLQPSQQIGSNQTISTMTSSPSNAHQLTQSQGTNSTDASIEQNHASSNRSDFQTALATVKALPPKILHPAVIETQTIVLSSLDPSPDRESFTDEMAALADHLLSKMNTEAHTFLSDEDFQTGLQALQNWCCERPKGLTEEEFKQSCEFQQALINLLIKKQEETKNYFRQQLSEEVKSVNQKITKSVGTITKNITKLFKDFDKAMGTNSEIDFETPVAEMSSTYANLRSALANTKGHLKTFAEPKLTRTLAVSQDQISEEKVKAHKEFFENIQSLTRLFKQVRTQGITKENLRKLKALDAALKTSDLAAFYNESKHLKHLVDLYTQAAEFYFKETETVTKPSKLDFDPVLLADFKDGDPEKVLCKVFTCDKEELSEKHIRSYLSTPDLRYQIFLNSMNLLSNMKLAQDPGAPALAYSLHILEGICERLAFIICNPNKEDNKDELIRFCQLDAEDKSQFSGDGLPSFEDLSVLASSVGIGVADWQKLACFSHSDHLSKYVLRKSQVHMAQQVLTGNDISWPTGSGKTELLKILDHLGLIQFLHAHLGVKEGEPTEHKTAHDWHQIYEAKKRVVFDEGVPHVVDQGKLHDFCMSIAHQPEALLAKTQHLKDWPSVLRATAAYFQDTKKFFPIASATQAPEKTLAELYVVCFKHGLDDFCHQIDEFKDQPLDGRFLALLDEFERTPQIPGELTNKIKQIRILINSELRNCDKAHQVQDSNLGRFLANETGDQSSVLFFVKQPEQEKIINAAIRQRRQVLIVDPASKPNVFKVKDTKSPATRYFNSKEAALAAVDNNAYVIYSCDQLNQIAFGLDLGKKSNQNSPVFFNQDILESADIECILQLLGRPRGSHDRFFSSGDALETFKKLELRSDFAKYEIAKSSCIRDEKRRLLEEQKSFISHFLQDAGIKCTPEILAHVQKNCETGQFDAIESYLVQIVLDHLSNGRTMQLQEDLTFSGLDSYLAEQEQKNARLLEQYHEFLLAAKAAPDNFREQVFVKVYEGHVKTGSEFDKDIKSLKITRYLNGKKDTSDTYRHGLKGVHSGNNGALAKAMRARHHSLQQEQGITANANRYQQMGRNLCQNLEDSRKKLTALCRISQLSSEGAAAVAAALAA